MKARAFCVTLLLLVSVTASAADTNRRDGNNWVSWEFGQKVMYVNGLFDGVNLGHNIDVWGLPKTKGGMDWDKISPLIDSFNKMTDKFFVHVTAGQLVAGLDDFYKHYRNRRIEIDDAIWIAMNEIAGTSKSEVERMIENFRRGAGCSTAPC